MAWEALRSSLGTSLILYSAGCGEVVNEAPDAPPAVDAPDSVDAAADAGADATVEIDAAVDAMNAVPVNANRDGTVLEAGTMSLEGRLVTADADNTPAELVYAVTSLPTSGVLRRDGVTLGVGDTFTQADVNDGLVVYIHDGAELPSDSFNWDLTDGTNTLPGVSFAISVTPVNDAPVIVNNPTSMIAEGGLEVLTPARLSATDAESGSNLTFTFVAAMRGTLQKRAGGTFNNLPINGTFTQADIVAGDVRFVDPGTDDPMLAQQQNTTAAFSWRVTDPDGGVNPASGANASSFTITSVDDPPAIMWRPTGCSNANGSPSPANPVLSLVDPDNPNNQYSICVVSIIDGYSQQVIGSTTTTTTTITVTITPVVRNGAAVLAAGSCVVANALGNITLSSSANLSAGGVVWRLVRGGNQVGPNHTMSFPTRCP